jgi:hypothetical protein
VWADIPASASHTWVCSSPGNIVNVVVCFACIESSKGAPPSVWAPEVLATNRSLGIYIQGCGIVVFELHAYHVTQSYVSNPLIFALASSTPLVCNFASLIAHGACIYSSKSQYTWLHFTRKSTCHATTRWKHVSRASYAAKAGDMSPRAEYRSVPAGPRYTSSENILKHLAYTVLH